MRPGAWVGFRGVNSTTVNLAGGTTNNVTILGTSTPVTVNANGAIDNIFVEAISIATTINLGGGNDTPIVHGTRAAALHGNGPPRGTHLPVVHRSAATA